MLREKYVKYQSTRLSPASGGFGNGAGDLDGNGGDIGMASLVLVGFGR